MHPEPETTWQKLVNDFRRLCIARRQDNHEAADRLMTRELPERIAEWAREAGLVATERRSRLMQMFEREQRRVDDAWVLHELLSLRVMDEVVPALRAQVFEAVREATGIPIQDRSTDHRARRAPTLNAPARVAFHDIPAVIDLLLEQEQQARKPWSVPTVAPHRDLPETHQPCLSHEASPEHRL